MKASLNQIESFYWVVRLGGISLAARHQNLTQPAVSSRIRELEMNLGTKLFKRTQGRLELTSIGASVFARVQPMLQLADEIDSQILQHQPMRGLLRIGFVESAALAGLANLLRRLSGEYPDLNTQVTVDIGTTLIRKLLSRQLDIVIAGDVAIGPNVATHCLGSTEVVWLASVLSNYPTGPMSITDLSGAPIFIITEDSPVYEKIRGLLPLHDLRRFHHCNSHPVILQLIAADHGVTFMPFALAKDYIARGLIRVLEVDPPQTQSFYLSFYNHESHSSGVRKLVQLIEDCLKEVGFIRS